MFPKGFEWVIVSVVLLFRVILPVAIAVLLIVFLVRKLRKPKDGPESPAAPRAADEGPAAPLQQAAPSQDVAKRIDRLLAEHNLTDRERDILVGIYQGKTQAQLAEELFLSRSTIGTYCTRAYEKLGVSSKDEALEALRRAAEQQ